jgi:hypothetical protein
MTGTIALIILRSRVQASPGPPLNYLVRTHIERDHPDFRTWRDIRWSGCMQSAVVSLVAVWTPRISPVAVSVDPGRDRTAILTRPGVYDC